MHSKNNIYLVANYVARPKDPKRTSEKGYMKDPDNIQYDEQLYVLRGIRNKDLEKTVILDLTDEKIIKNSYKSGATFAELFEYYYSGFGDYIDESVNKLNETI